MNRLPSNPTSQDIPPAQRQPTEVSLYEIENISKRVQPPQKRRHLPIKLLSIAVLAALALWQRDTIRAYALNAKASLTASGAASGRGPWNQPSSEPVAQQAKEPAIARHKIPSAPAKTHPETLLNHRRYDEASSNTLVKLNPNSDVRLQPAAQASLNAMIAKAKADGVQLGAVSGFRSLADQDYLYFKVKAERGESAKTRAEVSAPPGYSEHHTGYAADLVDESQPDTYVEESFETTPAYRWLIKNAAFYNFEMSFPKNNQDSLAYEPWHWRYVGDQKSLELFYEDQP
ncbi:MAG: M15 family metallopeptidase [Phormidesmis sp.]